MYCPDSGRREDLNKNAYLLIESLKFFFFIEHFNSLWIGPVFNFCNEVNPPCEGRVVIFSILCWSRPFKSRKFTSGIHLNNLDNYIAKGLILIILMKQTNNLEWHIRIKLNIFAHGKECSPYWPSMDDQASTAPAPDSW